MHICHSNRGDRAKFINYHVKFQLDILFLDEYLTNSSYILTNIPEKYPQIETC